ncbi:MAG: flagellar hook-basal body complex protein [Proteobacteria bacterium]|nr:flagellar hook-basal body complex protein [Pseudomonadota bacterium]
MSGYGLFQTSTLGMNSQANRLNTIGTNIANVNTGGYRRTDTEFQTVLSDNVFQQSDIGGVLPVQRRRYDLQGLITPTDRNLDLAISGQGFFAVQPNFSSTTKVYYTRDGSFQVNTVNGQTTSVLADDGTTNITVNNGYLVDKNGYFVLGSPVQANGTVSSSGAAPMRVDSYAFTNVGNPTTQSTLEFNLPSNDNFGATAHSYTLRTYDSNATERAVTFNFSRSITDNQWQVAVQGNNLTTSTLSPGANFGLTTGTTNQLTFNAGAQSFQLVGLSTGIPVNGAFSSLKAGNQITLTGTASNNSTFTIASVSADGSTITVTGGGLLGEAATGATAINIASTAPVTSPLIFNGNGILTSPTSMTLAATWSDGATSNFTVDTSGMKQFAGAFTTFRTSQDGFGKANMTGISFDPAGNVVGAFSDGTERNVYKIPLYTFTNINGLHADNGMVFEETSASGTATAFFADQSTKADFINFSHEISNVDIATEFARMIQTQEAYNLNATTFRTIDEMTVVARDLKA